MAVVIGEIRDVGAANPTGGVAGGQPFDRTMMGTIAFDLALDRFKEEVVEKFRKRIAGVVETVHEGVIARTPVDTGQAVANWQVTMNAPFSGILGGVGQHDSEARNAPLGSERNRARANAVARASRAAVHYRNPFIKYWIANNTPFIVDLEYGVASPRKAPQGMLGVTISAARAGL